MLPFIDDDDDDDDEDYDDDDVDGDDDNDDDNDDDDNDNECDDNDNDDDDNADDHLNLATLVTRVCWSCGSPTSFILGKSFKCSKVKLKPNKQFSSNTSIPLVDQTKRETT